MVNRRIHHYADNSLLEIRGRLLDDVRAGVTDLTSTHRAPIELYSEGFEW